MVLAIDGKNRLEVAAFSISVPRLSIFIFRCGNYGDTCNDKGRQSLEVVTTIYVARDR
jgi:hypothetical protein